MKLFLTLFAFSISQAKVNGQTISLTYDNYGNRLTKSVIGTYPNLAITGDSIKCQGTTINWSATGGITYLWSTGSTQSNINFIADSTRIYSVTATNSLGCSKKVNRLFVAKHTPAAALILGDSVVYARSTTAYISSQNSNSFYDWQLTNSNNTIVSGYPTRQININWNRIPGTERISLRLQDTATQCYSSYSYKQVTILVGSSITGELMVTVYPNPGHDDINVKIELARVDKADITVFDDLGRTLYTTRKTGNAIYTLQLSSSLFVASGTYYVKVETTDEKVTQKLLTIK